MRLANFVQESAAAPGTGPFVLMGAPMDRCLFSAAFPGGGSVYYFATDGAQAEWGIGTLDVTGPVVLERTTIAGTTAGAGPANFAGDVQVYNEVPAEYLPLIGTDGLARAGDAVLVDRGWLGDNYADTAWLTANFNAVGWFPAGAVVDYAAEMVPDGWLPCQGQAVSRTTYAALFSAIGTRYGAGDGSTSFNVPDARNRASFGVDNMGGPAAGRVSVAASGINGGQLGAVGGSEAAPTHTHEVTDPGHSHGVTDPGHGHDYGYRNWSDSGSHTAHPIVDSTPGQNGNYTTASAKTGLSIHPAATGLSIASSGTGASQNVPPAIVMNRMIYTGNKPKKSAASAPPLTVRAVLVVPFTDTIPRTITWETSDGTAIAGTDYEDTEGGLLIPPGWQQVVAYIPITPRLPGLPALNFDVVFKWYDKTVQPVGYGTGQFPGWPIYPVARQTVQVTIADMPLTIDTSDLPADAHWTTRDGSALAGKHYLAASGDNGGGSVTIQAAPYSRGQASRTLYVDFTDAGGLIATRTVTIAPPAIPTASAAPISVAVATVALPACIPKILIDTPHASDNPDMMPISTMRALASDWHIANQGSDQTATMTLRIAASGCALQIFGGYFAGLYSQPDSGTIEITGTAEQITAIRSQFQARPTASGATTIVMTLTGPDGSTDNATYAVSGVASAMSWSGLPAAGAVLAVQSPSTGIPGAGSSLTVANADPFAVMTLTIEPDEYGGRVVGPVGEAVSVSATGRGIVITGDASVVALVLVPLTIYVGDGITPPPTAGSHVLTMTASDGTSTITAQYSYSVTL